MKSWFLALSLAAGTCPAQIGPPQLGFVLDGTHSLRPLLGFSGNWMLGDSLAAGVLNAVSSGSFTLLKTDTSISVLDGTGSVLSSLDADPGPASFAFDTSGQPGLVWVRSAGLLAWRTDHWDSLPASGDALGGEVLSLASAGSDRVRFFIQRSDGLWLVETSTADGSLLSQTALPGMVAPVLLQPDGSLVYTDQTAIVFRAVDGTERRLELGFAAAEFHPIGVGWLQVSDRDSTRQFAIRTQAGLERMSQLPEVQPCCGN